MNNYLRGEITPSLIIYLDPDVLRRLLCSTTAPFWDGRDCGVRGPHSFLLAGREPNGDLIGLPIFSRMKANRVSLDRVELNAAARRVLDVGSYVYPNQRWRMPHEAVLEAAHLDPSPRGGRLRYACRRPGLLADLVLSPEPANTDEALWRAA